MTASPAASGQHPLVEDRQVQRDRNEQDGHQRQIAGRRFEDPAGDQAPGAAAEILDHEQRERSSVIPIQKTNAIRYD